MYCTKPKGDHPGQVHSDQMVLRMIRRGRRGMHVSLTLLFCDVGKTKKTEFLFYFPGDTVRVILYDLKVIFHGGSRHRDESQRLLS